jgi:hypothetical protein
MKNANKILKVLLELKGDLPPKNPPKNIKKILSQIELFEFYESDSDTFRGQGFKWKDYIDYYKAKTKKDYFSYHEDWAGYNIPCTSLESCIQKIPDLNIYDMIMFSVVDTIRKIVGSDDFYLIGIDQSNGEDPSLIFHEMAHGLWFSSPRYKREMSSLIENMNSNVRENMINKIKEAGYGDNVYEDELQAYLSTGVDGSMRRIKDIKPEIYKFTQAFEKYSKKIKPKKIPIDWSTDLDR